MVQQLLPIAALLLGSAFLLFAGGINGLLLPIRGTAEGFPTLSLGLLGTGWAIGYISGCVLTPRIVGRVGHIRAFGVMAAAAALSILASYLAMSPWAWIPLRAISGFAFAGAAMIVESWLSEQSDPRNRGKVFGLYTMVNLFSSTLGQLSLAAGDPATGAAFFIIGAMFYCLALIPSALSSTVTPKPLVSVRLDLGSLWRNSPVAVLAVLMVGISNSAFGTLAAVYADKVGLVLVGVALFSSLPILAGALSQIPIGYLSDSVDRRLVLIGLTLVALAADLSFLLLDTDTRWQNLAMAGLFGTAVYAMYPVILAHANDHAAPGTYIQTSGGLLLVYGIGGIVGPFMAGILMSALGPNGLFVTTIGAHIVILIFTGWRVTQRKAVDPDQKTAFIATPPARASTPETAAMALREDKH